MVKPTNKYPSQSEIHDLFEYRNGHLYWRISRGKAKVGKQAGSKYPNGYIDITISGQHHLAHRLIWIYHNGYLSEEMYIDHINRKPDDNRIENLRLSDVPLNSSNKRVSRNDKWKHLPAGVYQNNGPGQRKESFHSKFRKKYLGTFDTPEEAHQAYLKAQSQWVASKQITLNG